MEIVARSTTDFMNGSQVWRVRSRSVGDEFQVCITAPQSAATASVGAVFMTDASVGAGLLASTIALLGLDPKWPRLFAVSIGYPADSEPPFLLKRNRDLTPTSFPTCDAAIAKLMGSSYPVASGGAAAFLEFLNGELRPVLHDEFGIDPNQSTLVGSSLGGLFVLNTLVTRPESFQRYLAVSPALWWDGKVVLREMAALVERRAHAPTAGVYMCCGELESAEHARKIYATLPTEILAAIPKDMREVDMHADMRAMEAVLSPWRGDRFTVESHVYPEESHESILGAALSRGLRKLHGTLQ